MGPRRDWRGYIVGLIEFGVIFDASMGPRRDWRGYNCIMTKSLASVSLQWGHAVIGVDTMTRPSYSTECGGGLQWGHAVIGVDTLCSRR